MGSKLFMTELVAIFVVVGHLSLSLNRIHLHRLTQCRLRPLFLSLRRFFRLCLSRFCLCQSLSLRVSLSLKTAGVNGAA